MHPAVTTRSPHRRKTLAILATSAAVVGAAALLHARGATRTVETGRCGDGAIARAGAGPATQESGAPVARASIDVGNGLRFAVRPQSCAILRGGVEIHVAVEVGAAAVEDHEREPVALALVVDRSRSMNGAPLADAKAAALHALDALDTGDAFSLVTYSTNAELILPLGPATEAHKARARAAIAAMEASGATNIYDALRTGAAALDGGCAGCATDHVSRIVLISDGDPNEGEVYDREGLAAVAASTAQGGTSLTTIGVGLEFDERIMTEMAIAGRGNYYFVERTADLASIFERELGSLGETVAVGTRVELTPAPGVEILEAYGYRLERGADAVVVPVADLRAGETRKVVLRIRVQSDAAGARELVAAALHWRPTGAHQERIARAAVAVTVTDDAAAADRSRVADAERQVQEARMAHALDEATEAYVRGDVVRADAIVTQQAAEASAAASAIGDADLAGRMQKVHERAKDNFATPASAGGTNKGAKATRDLSYGLAR